MVFISASPPSCINPAQPGIASPNPWQEVSQRLFYLLSAHQEPEALLVNLAAELDSLLPHDTQVMILSRFGPAFTSTGGHYTGRFQHPLDWTWAEPPTEQLLRTPIVSMPLEPQSYSGPVDTLLTAWQAINDSETTPQSLLTVPTQFQGSVNGVLSLVSTQPHTWTESEISGVTAAARPIEIALSQLHFKQRLHQQERFRTIASQLALTLRNASDLGEIIQLATAGTAQALQVSRGLLLRLKYGDPLFKKHRKKQRQLEEYSQVRISLDCEWSESLSIGHETLPKKSSASESPSSSSSFWLADCDLCRQAFTQPHQVVTLADTSHVGDRVAAPFNLQTFASLAMVPLESQGMVLGFLAFQRHQPSSWSPDEVELIQLVAAQLSAALIQTETLRQVQSLVDSRTAELQQSLDIQAKLYDLTRQQIDQLRRLNQVKDEFLESVNHELRMPLTIMTMAIRLLRQKSLSGHMLSPDHHHAIRHLDILEEACAKEVKLVEDLLAFQELEGKKTQLPTQNAHNIDVLALVKDLAIAFDQQWSAKGLTLELHVPPHPLRMQTDSGSLNRILVELLTNAGKYADADSTIHLHVDHRIEPGPSQVIFSLRNIGTGIDANDLPQIFEKFWRSQSARQNAVPGTGLGLALVKSLVQHLNGSIAAASHSSSNARLHETCFTLTIPQALEIPG